MNTAKNITLWVSSPDSFGERKLGNDLTLSQLSDRLEIITGIPRSAQYITLQQTDARTGHGEGDGNESSRVIRILSHDDQTRTLEQCGVVEWMTIRVDSTDPNAKSLAGQFSDTRNVEKFNITKEEYEARPDTVRSFKQLHKLGRFSTPASPSSHPAASVILRTPPLPASFKLGARCQVAISDELFRRGAIRFIGETEFGTKVERQWDIEAKGTEDVWIGVEFDEPVGKGDGLVDGKRYFQTQPMRASFVRPNKVEVGDYPEIDPFAEDDFEGLDEM